MASTLSRTTPRAFAPLLRASIRSQRSPLAIRPSLPTTTTTTTSLSHSWRGYGTRGEQPRLRLGSTAPDFTAETTQGKINFHEWLGDSWGILFSHPADRTPVCTTELGAFARLGGEFEKRGVKMIGLSVDKVGSHEDWIEDINDISSTQVRFPIIADEHRDVAWLYDMLPESATGSKDMVLTIRSVFIIDPNKKIRLSMTYPASTGRNSAEVLRVIDSLQTTDKLGLASPIDWQVGDDLIVPVPVSTEKAKEKFADVREVRPYLRFTSGKGKSS